MGIHLEGLEEAKKPREVSQEDKTFPEEWVGARNHQEEVLDMNLARTRKSLNLEGLRQKRRTLEDLEEAKSHQEDLEEAKKSPEVLQEDKTFPGALAVEDLARLRSPKPNRRHLAALEETKSHRGDLLEAKKP